MSQCVVAIVLDVVHVSHSATNWGHDPRGAPPGHLKKLGDAVVERLRREVNAYMKLVERKKADGGGRRGTGGGR